MLERRVLLAAKAFRCLVNAQGAFPRIYLRQPKAARLTVLATGTYNNRAK